MTHHSVLRSWGFFKKVNETSEVRFGLSDLESTSFLNTLGRYIIPQCRYLSSYLLPFIYFFRFSLSNYVFDFFLRIKCFTVNNFIFEVNRQSIIVIYSLTRKKSPFYT